MGVTYSDHSNFVVEKELFSFIVSVYFLIRILLKLFAEKNFLNVSLFVLSLER